jgi:hypothetical protein
MAKNYFSESYAQYTIYTYMVPDITKRIEEKYSFCPFYSPHFKGWLIFVEIIY